MIYKTLSLTSLLVLLCASGCDTTPMRMPPPDSGAGTDAALGTDAGNGTDSGEIGTDACVPACSMAECGPDGCGGTCGACAEGSCVAGMCDNGPGGSCPPTGEAGLAVGDIFPDIAIMDTEGAMHNLRDSCMSKATWIVAYADWCPTCKIFAMDGATPTYEAFADDDVQAFYIITENASTGAPSMELCRAVKENYDLPMTVLCDTDGVFAAVGGRPNSYGFVLTQGSEVFWAAQYRESMIATQVREALAL